MTKGSRSLLRAWDRDDDNLLLDYVDNMECNIKKFAKDTGRDFNDVQQRLVYLRNRGRKCDWDDWKKARRYVGLRLSMDSPLKYVRPTRNNK